MLDRPGRAARAAIAGALLAASPAFADEQPFGYLYVTDTLPKGVLEYEQWATANYRQSRGSYLGMPLRSELEYGITDNFQGSLYLNYSFVNANQNGVSGETSGPGVPENAAPDARYRRWRFDGASAEFVYRLLSPYKDPFGFALYLEPTWGNAGNNELEAKLLFQKNFLDDRLILAANVTAEWEREVQTGNPALPPDDPEASPRIEKETQLEFGLGASYLFAPGWRAGIEYRNVNHYAGAYSFSSDNKEWQASYLGPNIHYASKKWWVTFTALGQLPAGHGHGDFQENIVGDRVYGSGGTRYAFRMRLGVFF